MLYYIHNDISRWSMKRKCILLLFILIILSGCENTSKEETTKSEYIAMKNQTFDDKNYNNEALPVEIITTIDRIDDETINYKITITNPKENMHNIKAIVVHNYYNEDTFPSIGVFDETKELLIDDDKKNELVLKNSINTTTNISKLNLELKMLIEYTNDNGETKDIYYKAT